MDSDSASDCTGSSQSYCSSERGDHVAEESLDYITLYLTEEDPTNTTFLSSSGKRLYQVSSTGGSSSPLKVIDTNTQKPHITRVSRLYGSAARAAREAALQNGSDADGLTLAEMEWMERTRSSRIRFNSGKAPTNQHTIDVRIDEFLKGTKGRSLSRMFAAPNGRIYKWKSDVDLPAELVECEEGRRISGPLVTFHSGWMENEMSSLRIATTAMPIIDQIIVSWVIMERERRILPRQ